MKCFEAREHIKIIFDDFLHLSNDFERRGEFIQASQTESIMSFAAAFSKDENFPHIMKCLDASMSPSVLFDRNLLKSIYEYTLDRCSIVRAARDGNVAALQYFHSKHLLFPEYEEEAFRIAALNGHLEFVKFMDENYDVKNQEVALNWASMDGREDVVQYLLERGSGIEKEYALQLAIIHGRVETVELILESGAEMTREDFEYAIVRENLEIVYLFVKRGWRIEQEDLRWVGSRGWINAFELLIKLGAKPSVETLRAIYRSGQEDIVYYYLEKEKFSISI